MVKRSYYTHKNQYLRPLLKTIGGKTKSRDRLYALAPENYHWYIEPFYGSGSVHIGLNDGTNYELTEMVNDSNGDIINFYKVVRTDPKELHDLVQIHIKALKKWGKDYFEFQRDNPPDFYNKLPRAAWLYLINKSCFNGIVRWNEKGECNSSYCHDAVNRGWMTLEWLELVRKRIMCTDYYSLDFKDFLLPRIIESRALQEYGWMFLDPPYFLKGKEDPNGTVTVYNGKKFTTKDHEDLRDLLHETNCKWLMTLNKCDWTLENYKKFEIRSNTINYCCSQTPKGRGKVEEIIITNYNSNGGLIK